MKDSTEIFQMDNFVIREADSFTVASLVSESFDDTAGNWRNSILPSDSGYISYMENEAGKVSLVPSIPAVQFSARKTSYDGTSFAGILSKSFTVDSAQLYNVHANIIQHSDSMIVGACYIINKDSVNSRGLNAIDYSLGYMLYYSDTSFNLPFTATYTGEVLVTFLQFNRTPGTTVIDSIALVKEKIDSTWFDSFDSNINGWRNRILLDQDTMPMVVGNVEYDGSGQRLKVTQGDFKLPADASNFLDTWGGVAAIDLPVEAGKRYRIKADIGNPENIDISQAFAGMVIKNTADLQENGLFASADMFNQNFYQDGNVITGVFNAGDNTTLTALFFIASMKNIQDAPRYYYLDNIVLEEVKVVKCGEEGTEPIAVNGKYRYGFNGKEQDNDVKGKGNQLDYGMRTYDPRLGKFLSTDPLQKKFAFYSVYQYSGNSPIANIDLDGLEPKLSIHNWENQDGYQDLGNYWAKTGTSSYAKEQRLSRVVDEGGTSYWVARRTASIFGREDFIWYDEGNKQWNDFTPTDYEDPKNNLLRTCYYTGEFGKYFEATVTTTAWAGISLSTAGASSWAPWLVKAISGASLDASYQMAANTGDGGKLNLISIGISGTTSAFGLNTLWQYGVKNAISNAVSYSTSEGYTGVGSEKFSGKGWLLNTAINTAVDGAMFKIQNPSYSFTDQQYDRALRLPNKNSSKSIINEYVNKGANQGVSNNSKTTGGVGMGMEAVNNYISDKSKNKGE